MIAILKQKNPVNLFLLLLASVLIKLPMFMHPHDPIVRPSDGILFEGIIRIFAGIAKSTPTFYPLLTFALLFIQGSIITRFINNQRMMNKPTYLPALAYILITSLFPEWNYFSAPLLCNTILLFILSGLFGVYNKQNARGAIFNIGLALGIASLGLPRYEQFIKFVRTPMLAVRESGFTLQLVLTGVVMGLVVWLAVRPIRSNPLNKAHLFALGSAALLCAVPLAGFLAIRPFIAELHQDGVGIGSGWWLTLLADLLLWTVTFATILDARSAHRTPDTTHTD